MPSELIDPKSALSGLTPEVREVTNWYYKLEDCTERMQEFVDDLRKNSNAPKFLHLNEYKMCDLERDLDIIDDEGRYREQPVEYVRRHTALKVLYELSEFLYQQMYNDKKIESDSGTKYEQQIFQTLEYIHANYDKKITVEDLASRVFLSRSTFIRSFNLITRTSPNRYIRQYRASKARELMKDGKIKKSEVARLSGYYDASHLYREIK